MLYQTCNLKKSFQSLTRGSVFTFHRFYQVYLLYNLVIHLSLLFIRSLEITSLENLDILRKAISNFVTYPVNISNFDFSITNDH